MFRITRNIKILNRYRLYHKKVINHYENPRNVGSFNSKEKKKFDFVLTRGLLIHINPKKLKNSVVNTINRPKLTQHHKNNSLMDFLVIFSYINFEIVVFPTADGPISHTLKLFFIVIKIMHRNPK